MLPGNTSICLLHPSPHTAQGNRTVWRLGRKLQTHTVTSCIYATDCNKTDLLELRLWNQNKTNLLKGFKWNNYLFLSYSTFVGLNISIFCFWDQQKYQNIKTVNQIITTPRDIYSYFGFKVLNLKDQFSLRWSVKIPSCPPFPTHSHQKWVSIDRLQQNWSSGFMSLKPK